MNRSVGGEGETVRYIEGDRIELKEMVTPDLKKELVAFANSEGGDIYIGVDKSGAVVGVEDVDEQGERIGNMVREAIQPDLTLFVRYEVREEAGRQLIVVHVRPARNNRTTSAVKGSDPVAFTCAKAVRRCLLRKMRFEK